MTNTAVVPAPGLANEEPALLTVTFAEPCRDVLVVTVSGEVDLATAPELDSTVRNEIRRRRPRSVVLDLSGVAFLGVHGTAVLERLRRHPTAIGTMLCLVAISSAGRRALELAGFLAEFDRLPDLATALCARP